MRSALAVEALFDLRLGCSGEQPPPEDHVVRLARDAAPEVPALSLDLTRREPPRKSGERAYDTECPAGNRHQAFFLAAGLATTDFAGARFAPAVLAAGSFAAATSLGLLLAGGLD